MVKYVTLTYLTLMFKWVFRSCLAASYDLGNGELMVSLTEHGNRPHAHNVNNMNNGFDCIHYKAGHDL